MLPILLLERVSGIDPGSKFMCEPESIIEIKGDLLMEGDQRCHVHVLFAVVMFFL